MKIEELRLTGDEVTQCGQDSHLGDTPVEKAAQPWLFASLVSKAQLAKIQRLAEEKPILFVDWERFCAGRSCSESCPGEIRHCPHFKEANVEVIENA